MLVNMSEWRRKYVCIYETLPTKYKIFCLELMGSLNVVLFQPVQISEGIEPCTVYSIDTFVPLVLKSVVKIF